MWVVVTTADKIKLWSNPRRIIFSYNVIQSEMTLPGDGDRCTVIGQVRLVSFERRPLDGDTVQRAVLVYRYLILERKRFPIVANDTTVTSGESPAGRSASAAATTCLRMFLFDGRLSPSVLRWPQNNDFRLSWRLLWPDPAGKMWCGWRSLVMLRWIDADRGNSTYRRRHLIEWSSTTCNSLLQCL